MSTGNLTLHTYISVLLVLWSAPVVGQTNDPVTIRQRMVEQGLLPAIVVEGEPEPAYSIHQRMAHYNVPGLSVAVIKQGHIDWASGYGVRRAGSNDPVTTSTLFQAASVSKPVTAVAALRLVEEAKVSLDRNVNQWLESWKVPAYQDTSASSQQVTLRHLLSHTGGTTVGGFPGYKPGDEIPSVEDVLEGSGNTDPVFLDTIPGSLFRYSGGGYTIVQLLIEDVTGMPFEKVLKELVLDPIGMYQSTFTQPLPERLTGEAAVAHEKDGSVLEGNWHVYPEKAAAGLWTTPSDLARFVLGVRGSYLGTSCPILQQATAKEMLTVHKGGYGLGPALAGKGRNLLYVHPGGNAGYRAFILLYPMTGDGLVVMCNGDRGRELNMEVIRAVSRVYHWPFFKAEVRTTVSISARTLEGLAGQYQIKEEPSRVLIVESDGNKLYLRWDGDKDQKYRLFPTSKTEFFMQDSGSPVVFRPNGNEEEIIVEGLRARRMQ